MYEPNCISAMKLTLLCCLLGLAVGVTSLRSEDKIEESLARAKGEALSSFGDDRVYVEKYISSPRHIEFQVLSDSKGNAVHLGERECSIQRRHQKLIEESPSVILDEKMRKEMGETVLTLVKVAKCEVS